MRLHALLAATAFVALPACVDSDTAATSPAVFAPTDADRASPAYQACVAAIATTTGRAPSEVTVVSFLFSEANTEVLATIPGAEAPWRCLSSTNGVVAEVIYTGSEGAL